MRIRMLLVATGFAFALALVQYPTPTAAYPKCNVKDCTKLSNTYSRSEIEGACRAMDGISTGTQAQSGGYAA